MICFVYSICFRGTHGRLTIAATCDCALLFNYCIDKKKHKLLKFNCDVKLVVEAYRFPTLLLFTNIHAQTIAVTCSKGILIHFE